MMQNLEAAWKKLSSVKQPLLTRYERYAGYTLPYIFPRASDTVSSTANTELRGAIDSVGAQAVNNLCNKIVMTLFQPNATFFRLSIRDDDLRELKQAAKAGDQSAIAALAEAENALADAEKRAMRDLGYNGFITEAITTVKHLLITGNALMYFPDNAKVQVYSVKDYCIRRDLSGKVLEIITRDNKAFGSLPPEIQQQIREAQVTSVRKFKPDTPVSLYTQVLLKEDGKYHLRQDADKVMLDSFGIWTADELPYITLTWNLVRGEDYGRGLVEDYAGAFHALTEFTEKGLVLAALAADVKQIVDPASGLDVKELNESPPGAYLSGNGSVPIYTVSYTSAFNMQFMIEQIQRYTSQIEKAFLMKTAVQRDAERVTAEEIRMVANDLEQSHGGIYSRLADEWQSRLAMLLMRRQTLTVGKDSPIYPEIITGFDSLSRTGELDNLRLFISDLQMLAAIPEPLLKFIGPTEFMQYVGVRRGVDYSVFTKSADQVLAEDQQAMQQQQQMMQSQTNQEIEKEATISAINQQQ